MADQDGETEKLNDEPKADYGSEKDDQTETAETAEPEAASPPAESKPNFFAEQKKKIEDSVKKAKTDSSNTGDFCCQVTSIFSAVICGTVCCGAWITFLLILPLVMLIVGAVDFYDCPAEPEIPIWMIITGSLGVLKAAINIWDICRRAKGKNDGDAEKGEGDHFDESEELQKRSTKHNVLDFLINFLCICWLITGSVWTYGIYGSYQSVDASLQNYCDSGLYLFTFWVITTTYIFFLLAGCCGCCIVSWLAVTVHEL